MEEIKTFDPTTQRTNEKIDSIRISSSKEEEKNLMEGAFLSYIQSPTMWVFQEPELLTSQFPLCFHESRKAALAKLPYLKSGQTKAFSKIHF